MTEVTIENKGEDRGVEDLNPPVFTRSEVERMIGGLIDPEVWEFIPWGHRLVIKRLPTPDMAGLVAIPDRAKEPLACGWIIRVGMNVGVPTGKYEGACPFEFITDLIGQQVMFGKFAGMPIKADTKSDPFEGEFLVLQEDDIWGHIRQPAATKETE